MDIATGLGLVAGAIVIVSLILMGGDLRMFYDVHAIIIIFGGSFAATLIRFPLTAMLHGLPLGAKFAFTMQHHHAARPRRRDRRPRRDRAQIRTGRARKGHAGRSVPRQGRPLRRRRLRRRLHPRQSRARPRQLPHPSRRGQKIYRAIGDCAPAFGMIGTLIGMVQMFANMTDPSKLGPLMAVALLATLYGALVANLFCLPIADKLHVKLVDRGGQPHADHRRHPDDPRLQEPDARARNAARLPAGKASRPRSRAGAGLTTGVKA